VWSVVRNKKDTVEEEDKVGPRTMHRPLDPEDPTTQDPEARLRRSLRLNRSIFLFLNGDGCVKYRK
jgi:hypothetical protein